MTTQSGRLGSLALAVLLAIGAGIVWAFFVGLGLSIVQEVFLTPSYFVGKRLVVLGNGTPVIEAYQSEHPKSFLSLDGKPLDSVDANNTISGQYMRDPRWSGWVGSSWSRRITWLPTQSSGAYYDPLNWYFIHDGAPHGHGYFVGYDPTTKLKVGCLGRNGFQPDEPTAEDQFPVDSHNWPLESAQTMCHLVFPVEQPGSRYVPPNRDLLYLVTGDGLLQVDLKARTAKVVRQRCQLALCRGVITRNNPRAHARPDSRSGSQRQASWRLCASPGTP